MRTTEEIVALGDVHTRYCDGVWQNELEGRGAVSSHSHEVDAIVAGRQLAIARGTAHVIHAEDGTVRRQQSYRGDRELHDAHPTRDAGTADARPT